MATALVAVTVLGLLTGIQLMAAPTKAEQAVKVVIGKHPPKASRAAAEAERIIRHWIPVLDGWLGTSISSGRNTLRRRRPPTEGGPSGWRTCGAALPSRLTVLRARRKSL